MAYNKTSEERKWNYWKEQEERNCVNWEWKKRKIKRAASDGPGRFFWKERRYREHLDEEMQDMDSIKGKDSEILQRGM